MFRSLAKVAKSQGKKLAKRGLQMAANKGLAMANRYLSGGCAGRGLLSSFKSIAKAEGKKLAKRGLKIAANKGLAMANSYMGTGMSKAHLVAGSAAAKEWGAKMKKLRACRRMC
jgi:hypothetical protein